MGWRAALTLLAVTTLGLVACRPDTVHLGFAPEPGETYRYRYEIDASITRQVEGEAPRTTSLHLTFESTQTVVEETPEGTRLEVTLTSDGSATSSAVVLLDRAGSLQAIQEVDGLPAEELGLPSGALLPPAATEPPDRPLSVGDAWSIVEGSLQGDGRLDRFEVLDRKPAAVVETSILDVLSDTTEQAGSQVVLDGDLRSTTATVFDLTDGSIRRSHSRGEGTVNVLVAPPPDVLAPAVEAVVTYDLDVTTTRLA